MKITSTCEKDFLIKCIVKNSRLDGRFLTEGRKLEITFGQEWGCCMVAMGNTRVLAQVSAEVTEPKAVTPSEGILHINLELSQMSSPDIQQLSRTSDEFVESQRVLERCIRDSKCIDLENLCIVAGSKVWTIRVDIHALNNDGNLVECASIAGVSALAHFKRPAVTVIGTDITVHSLDDKIPVSLNVHHKPINVNMALFDNGEHIVIDPLEIEEKIADGCYIIGANARQEICLVHRKGALLLSSDTIKKCEDIAIRRSQTVNQAICNAIDDDEYKRKTKAPIGFVNMLKTGTILGMKCPVKEIDIKEIAKNSEPDLRESKAMEVTVEDESTASPHTRFAVFSSPIVSQAGARAKKILSEAETGIFEGGSSKWKDLSSDESSDSDDGSTGNSALKTPLKSEPGVSSEDEAVTISAEQLDVKPAGSRGWYSKDPFTP